MKTSRPDASLHKLLEQTCNALAVRRSHVATGKGDQLSVLVGWQDARPLARENHALTGTPWGALHRQPQFFSIESDGDLFPDLDLLPSDPVRAYAGYPLLSSDGDLRGHLCVVHDAPVPPGTNVRPALALAADRLVSDIEDWGVLGAPESALEEVHAHRAEDEYRVMARNAACALVALSRTGEVLAWNAEAARLHGYTKQQALGKNFIALSVPEVQRDSIREKLSAVADGSGPVGYETAVVGADGVQRHVLWRVSACGEGQSGFIEQIAVGHDVTAQRQMEARNRLQQNQLARLERLSLLSEMMAGIAHEINQPLTAISTYAQSCLRFVDPHHRRLERVPEALEKLSAQAHRAGEVVERVRLLAQQQEHRSELVNCNRQLELIENLAAMDLQARGIHLRLDLADNLPAVWCDPIQIQQVVFNLIHNAVDAMEAVELKNGVEIVLRTSVVDGNAVQIAVVDCGEGVSEAAEDLFQPFTTYKSTSIGMGLPVSRSIVSAHDGQLDYFRNPLGGTTFILELPCAPGEIDYGT